jgi:RNA polymerase sigma-70 factor (ECF subfamily)
VCRTVYLAFTAGYTPGTGDDLLRADLAGEAVRLAAMLHDLMPNAPQVRAMLALLLLQHSRRDARHRHGRLVTLADQDRSKWHQDEIRAGLLLVAHIGPDEGYAEELRLQAVIAAEHARSSTAAETDWSAIARHYARLEARTASAVVRLNRAVAVAEAENPRAGLALLVGLDEFLPTTHRVAAVRGELAHRTGDIELARKSYHRAIELCTNEVERDHLHARLAAINTPNR